MKLQVKFRENSAEDVRQRIIHRIMKIGATDVHPLFPGEADAELATLYIVNTENPQQGKELLKVLNSQEEVEFAEPEVQRKLID
jgi:hypothetical protein